MFHKAVQLKFLSGTALEMTFQDGQVKRYDMAALFEKYPQLQALQSPALFRSGQLMGGYGIVWNDELDIDAETIYQDGQLVRLVPAINQQLSQTISAARAQSGLTQSQVASAAGIDQSDFSKIERGMANPSLATLERIAAALGCTLSLQLQPAGK